MQLWLLTLCRKSFSVTLQVWAWLCYPVQGSKKFPSAFPGQVDFLARQITFKAHLPNGPVYSVHPEYNSHLRFDCKALIFHDFPELKMKFLNFPTFQVLYAPYEPHLSAPISTKRILYISGKLPTYPSPKPTFCPKWEVSINVGLGEG